LLDVEAAISLHGATGDNCWNPENVNGWGYDCHRRRSHYRHRANNNAIRRRKRRSGNHLPEAMTDFTPVEPMVLASPQLVAPPAAVLVLYRQGKDSPVHAVAAEVWRGSQQVAVMEAIHCMGMRGDKVAAYIRELLASLHEQFGVSKFEDVIKELPVDQCPIKNCPLKG